MIRVAEVAPATDEELMFEVQQGDEVAFEQLVQRYQRELLTYLFRKTGSREGADDVWQDTLLNLFRYASQYDTNRKLRPWIYTIATNLFIDWDRRQRRRNGISLEREVVNGEEKMLLRNIIEGREPEAEVEESIAEERMRIRRLVAALPPKQRTAVRLVYFKGLKYREAADQMNIPMGTVKSSLHTALGKLGLALEAEDLLNDNQQSTPHSNGRLHVALLEHQDPLSDVPVLSPFHRENAA